MKRILGVLIVVLALAACGEEPKGSGEEPERFEVDYVCAFARPEFPECYEQVCYTEYSDGCREGVYRYWDGSEFICEGCSGCADELATIEAIPSQCDEW